jgi:hypothetical protein
MRGTRTVLVVGLVAAAFALAFVGCGGDDDEGAGDTDTTETTGETTTNGTDGGALQGSVGPGFEISLSTSDGAPVETLTAGSYELTVEDLSDQHNFHLTGEGVDVQTDVAEEGTESFTVELQAGTYEFVCDPHASSMNGSFEVS